MRARAVVATVLTLVTAALAAPQPGSAAQQPAPADPPTSTAPAGRPYGAAYPATGVVDERRNRWYLLDQQTVADTPTGVVGYSFRTGQHAVVPGLSGATGLGIDPDADLLWAVKPGEDEVVSYSLQTLRLEESYEVPSPCGRPVVVQGLVWLDTGCGSERLSSLDPATGEVTVLPPLELGDGADGGTVRLGGSVVADPVDPAGLLALDGDFLYRFTVDPTADPQLSLVARRRIDNVSQVATSARGRLVYLAGHGRLTTGYDLATLAPRVALPETGGHYTTLAAAPDGTVAVADGGPTSGKPEIYLYDAGRTSPYRGIEVGPAEDDYQVSPGEPLGVVQGGLVIRGHQMYVVVDRHDAAPRIATIDTRRPTVLTTRVWPRRVVVRVTPAAAGRRVVLRAGGPQGRVLERRTTDARGRVNFRRPVVRTGRAAVVVVGDARQLPATRTVRVRR